MPMTTQAYKLFLFTLVFLDNELWQCRWYLTIHATRKMVPFNFFIEVSVHDFKSLYLVRFTFEIGFNCLYIDVDCHFHILSFDLG